MGPKGGSTPLSEGPKERAQPARFISFYDSWEASFHFPKVHAQLAWKLPAWPAPGRAADKTLRFGTKRLEAQNTATFYRPVGLPHGHTSGATEGQRGALRQGSP